MSYILTDIATKVKKRIRDISYDTSEVYDYINNTLNDIYNEYRLPFMQSSEVYTTRPNTSDVTHDNLPEDYVQVLDLVNITVNQQKVIPYKDIREIDILYPSADTVTQYPAGPPKYWYWYAGIIRVFPAPDSAYRVQLRYYKKPDLLVKPNDVPELPNQFEELLVVGAAYRIMQIKDNYDQAAILENKYTELLQKLVVQSAQIQVGHPYQMRTNRYRVGRMSF